MPWSLKQAHQSLRDWWPLAGFDHAGNPYLIASVDVQQDWFRLTVRAWNKFSQSRLLHTDTLTTAGRIAEICDLLGVMRERTVLDRRHKPQQVRMWCAQFGWRSLQGEGETELKGQKDYLHPDGIRRVVSPPEKINALQGFHDKDIPHWMPRESYVVEHKFAKWSCLDRLNLLRQLTANDGTPLFTAADDAPEWYYRELDGWSRIPKFRNGIEVGHEYMKNGPNHTADTEIMGIAVASALNLTGAESIETPTGPEDRGQKTEAGPILQAAG